MRSLIFFHRSLSSSSLEKEREHGMVSVFLLLKSSLATWCFSWAFSDNPSISLASLMVSSPNSATRVFSASEHEYSKLRSSRLDDPSSTIPILNQVMATVGWRAFAGC